LATWIRNGRLADTITGVFEEKDLIIEGKRIEKIIPRGQFSEGGESLDIIEADGMLVLPGLIDMHVHLREPGEDVWPLSRADSQPLPVCPIPSPPTTAGLLRNLSWSRQCGPALQGYIR